MNKQQLANKIWESANKMRSKIEANEYKDYILGFIFYKYLSDQEIRFLKENDFEDEDICDLTEEDQETVEYIQKNIGYYISYENLFSTWIQMGRDFDVTNVMDALSAFSRNINSTHKKVFENIFQTLETGLSKLGDSSGARTKAISGLLQLIREIPMDGKQDYDVLGFIYEYLIEKFAANAGKKAGEFYTPHEVSLLMSEIVAEYLKDRSEIKIYDPTSGSGSLLINIGQSASKYIKDNNNIKYYAQELKENTYNLTRMNLVMRGIKPDNIVTRNGDTLEEDWPYFDENDPANTYDPLHVDAVVSNPPYSQAWDPSNKEHDPRYSHFGLAPKGKADYAFLLHDLFHLKSNGIMTIVLPHGVLFRGGEEGEIRKNLIENNHIDAIIGLPANIFFGTGIPTIIMVLKQKRQNNDILIVDASKGFIKEGKNNKLRASDIKRITDTVAGRKTINKYSRIVSKEEVRDNDYNLNIPRYVDVSESAESWDLYASMFGGIPMSEINELNDYWNAFPTLKEFLFTAGDIPYVQLAKTNIKKEIYSHQDIIKFKEDFQKAFGDFADYLVEELIEKMSEVEIARMENKISDHMFERLSQIPMIDKYVAYQLLDDHWREIAIDLEVIQTEGFEALKKVDPNLIMKKKAGREQEIQDGWIGHILPFDLVQSEILSDQFLELKKKEERLAQIPSYYEELIDSMTEEEKETEVLNEACDAFVAKEVSKKIKELRLEIKTDEIAAFQEKLMKYDKLAKEEKKLKSEIKSETASLHVLTKETIETLSDEQVFILLKKKWIENLVKSLNCLPDMIVEELIGKVEALQNKYAETYFEVEAQIKETEKRLCEMMNDLQGNEFDMKGLREFQSLLKGSKMKGKREKPEIRFQGFNEAWEQRKLGEFGKATGGTSIESEFCEGGKYKVISIGSYSDNSKYTDQGIRTEKTKKTESKILNKNDLTMILNDKTSSGNIIGRVLLINADDSYVYNQRTERIEVNKDDYEPEFLYQLLNADNIRQKIVRASQGNTQIYVNWTAISEINYEISKSKEEQRKIAKYFSHLDHLITLHQRKCDRLVNVKKSMLEKMFPKNGSNKPEVRFQGFTEAWEQRKLDDIAEFSKGSGYSKGDLIESGTPIILYGRLYTKYETSISNVDTFVEAKNGSVYSKGGEVIVPASGETAEDIARVATVDKSGILLGGDLNVVMPNEDINSAFLAISISNGNSQRELAKKAQGKSVVHIHNEEIRNLVVPFPAKVEQSKIVTYFSNLDHLITLHQRELEKLQNIKKSMLEKMFV